MKKANVLATSLIAVGGVNWGLVSIAELDLVAKLFGLRFGETNAATRTIYGLVGAATVLRIAQSAGVLRTRDATPEVASV